MNKPSFIIAGVATIILFGSMPMPASSSREGSSNFRSGFTSPTERSSSRNRDEKVIAVLATPIEFYGKVIDQYGQPVANANVDYTSMDKFDRPGTKSHGVSDETGNFSIRGVHGAVLTVGVSKEGYQNQHGQSDAAFAYGMASDNKTKRPPTKSGPAIFVLRKLGETEPLIRIATGGIKVPKDGTAIDIDIDTGNRTRNKEPSLKVQAWTNNDGISPNGRHPYDWRCRVSIPSGELIERSDGQLEFKAPSTGYTSADEVAISKDDPNWQSGFRKEYFMHFSDRTYARLQFEFTSHGDHFFIVTGYHNPKPDSRNLELEPRKVVKPNR